MALVCLLLWAETDSRVLVDMLDRLDFASATEDRNFSADHIVVVLETLGVFHMSETWVNYYSLQVQCSQEQLVFVEPGY